MFNWLSKDEKRQTGQKVFGSVTEGLQKIYKNKLLPIEKEFLFHQFYSAELTDSDFAARPMVLLLGQYSTGKSTFIRHLLGRDYPGLRIGPEPTTDKFVAITHGETDQVIPGNALVVDPSMPFTQLSHYGNQFLTRFECAKCNCPVLQGMTLIDSPGVLAGEKQRLNRGYEFESVCSWFADRVDSILVLFDVSKLDISDEFRRVILSLKGNTQKVHIILNKADRVNTPQLMRVYGALMWSLGKVLDTPETCRVYIGSFWDQPLSCDEQRKLFESEENDLYTMLAQLPRGAAVRKLNDLIKRARLAKVHAFILDYLHKKMPSMFGKSKEKQKLIDKITTIYTEISKERGLPLGDFPDPTSMQEKLASQDFTKFKKLDKKKMDLLEEMLTMDVPQLLQLVPAEGEQTKDAELMQVGSNPSPFAVMKTGGATESSAYAEQWLQPPDPSDYCQDFQKLDAEQKGKVSGAQAKEAMVQSKLPSNVLHKIWSLSDVDKDGHLNLYEYSLAMHFIKMKLEGLDLPSELPPAMAVPPEL
jgi:GTP-binding protein EngB required for normal cell division